jgi:hypothetical protein
LKRIPSGVRRSYLDPRLRSQSRDLPECERTGGAARLMRIETSLRISGYPGVAAGFFLVAAAGGFGLLFQILRRDQPPPS